MEGWIELEREEGNCVTGIRLRRKLRGILEGCRD